MEKAELVSVVRS